MTLDRELKGRKIYEFEKVELSPELSPGIFECVPPSGYTVNDRRDPEKFKRELAERKARRETAQEILNTRDVKQIKTLLTHPEWEIRIQALWHLQSLLKNDPNELIEIAESLKDDPVPAVRKKASSILAEKK